MGQDWVVINTRAVYHNEPTNRAGRLMVKFEVSSSTNASLPLSSSRLSSLPSSFRASLLCSSSPVSISPNTHALRTISVQWATSWRGKGAGFMPQWRCCSPWLLPWSACPLRSSWPASPSFTCLSCRCCVPFMCTWRRTSDAERAEGDLAELHAAGVNLSQQCPPQSLRSPQ